MKPRQWINSPHLLPEEFFEAEDADLLEPVARLNHGADFEVTFEDFFLELPLTPDCDRI